MTDHPFILPGAIQSRYPLEELGRRLALVDLVAADIDECLFPGFSQTFLGYLTFYQISTRPRTPRDLRFLPQLLRGGAYIRRVDLMRRLGRWPTHDALMQRYVRSMSGIPMSYFLEGARTIPCRSFPGAMRILRRLARRAPVGFVSFGVHLIAEEYARQAGAASGHDSFFAANEIIFGPDRSGRLVFQGYRRPLMTRPSDKLAALERFVRRFDARVPLVIGNGRDEAEMARAARELGGLSIGFRPAESDRPAFDVVLLGRSWRAMATLMERA